MPFRQLIQINRCRDPVKTCLSGSWQHISSDVWPVLLLSEQTIPDPRYYAHCWVKTQELSVKRWLSMYHNYPPFWNNKKNKVKCKQNPFYQNIDKIKQIRQIYRQRSRERELDLQINKTKSTFSQGCIFRHISHFLGAKLSCICSTASY